MPSLAQGLGFIIANIPGLLVGGYAGNRLGAVRDAKREERRGCIHSAGRESESRGVSTLLHSMMTESLKDAVRQILRALAMKVLGTASSL